VTESYLTDPAEMLKLAEEAAAAGGDFLRQSFGQAGVLSQAGRDIKLTEDERSQELITKALRERSDLPILAEEGGWLGELANNNALYWVVDPLDGSYNFKNTVPLFAVSIALCKGREPLLGCILDPIRQERFSGGLDLGLAIDGQRVRHVAPKRDLFASGIPTYGDSSVGGLAAIATHLEYWRKLRMIGSAALSLAWVAAGRFDGYSEAGIFWWDVAAGLALVKAVGGSCSVQGDIEEPLVVFAERRQ